MLSHLFLNFTIKNEPVPLSLWKQAHYVFKAATFFACAVQNKDLEAVFIGDNTELVRQFYVNRGGSDDACQKAS